MPPRLVPTWFAAAHSTATIHLVPLLWKRELALPDGHQLEAWFVWSENDTSQEWLIDPKAVLDADPASANGYHLQTLVYPASFMSSDRKHRLSCAGLFRYLVEKSGPKLWVTDERSSLGIMTDFAYHTAYGKLRL